jgi:glycosyltransferase involved in cell wall biosynthesis
MMPGRQLGGNLETHRRPKASVCIPAYQAHRHLRMTIDSVLAQDYEDMEVVIVDNNSTDGTREILEALDDHRIRVFRNSTTLSIYENWNRAVRETRGAFVKLVCADDLIEPNCLSAQVAVLETHPGVAIVSARADFVDSNAVALRRATGLRGIVGRQPGNRVVKQIVRSSSNPIGPAAAVTFRRVDFDRCSGFGSDLLFPMDLDLWVRLLRDGDFYGLPEAFASFRIWDGSITAVTSATKQRAELAEFARLLVKDSQWRVSGVDRMVGRLASFDLRFALFYELSRLRAHFRRESRGLEPTRGETVARRPLTEAGTSS